MATRVKAAAVSQAHMRLKEKWTVYKCVKSVLVPNTALFMMWTEDDVKHHPSTVFQGNVRIASLKGVAAGIYVFTFKDKQCDLLSINYEHMDEKEKAARTALKRKAVASLALGVYNV